MFCRSFCAAVSGIKAHVVNVEADIADGMPVFLLVGYLNSEVREAKERVRGAIKNAGFFVPPKRITINLSPADEKKEGTSYDLAIAMALLAAMGEVREDNLSDVLFAGELSLNGYINPVRGILPIIFSAKEHGFRYVIIPEGNRFEGSLVEGINVIGAGQLSEVIKLINDGEYNDDMFIKKYDWEKERSLTDPEKDFSDIEGQIMIKRAAKIAAAGAHNMLMMGPPGTGKSMIAERLPGILPVLTHDECIEVASIYSVYNKIADSGELMINRPFRSPHHSIPPGALIGGGITPKPGEISLAHKGILFLDELTEFNRATLEMLRVPLEEKKIVHSRNKVISEFPADFILIGAMNPCPCGYYPDRKKCLCSDIQIKRYLNKLSAPFLDRFDIVTQLQPVSIKNIIYKNTKKKNESSAEMREDVLRVVKIQEERFKNSDINRNSHMDNTDIKKWCEIDKETEEFLTDIYERFDYSIRGYFKVLKLARTIADLDGSDDIKCSHVKEAAAYRCIDRYFFRGGIGGAGR